MQTRQSPPHTSTEGGPETVVAVGDPDHSEGKAHWTTADEEELIQFLVDNKSAAGDGGNFKKVTWMAAATHMKKVTTKGGVKTADGCKNKWNRVSS